jgi:hypothetical protein
MCEEILEAILRIWWSRSLSMNQPRSPPAPLTRDRELTGQLGR